MSSQHIPKLYPTSFVLTIWQMVHCRLRHLSLYILKSNITAQVYASQRSVLSLTTLTVTNLPFFAPVNDERLQPFFAAIHTKLSVKEAVLKTLLSLIQNDQSDPTILAHNHQLMYDCMETLQLSIFQQIQPLTKL